jgi:uncharacterized protein (DUF58 family)
LPASRPDAAAPVAELAAGGTFPLVTRRHRLLGSAFGGISSLRRGPGSDVAGSRPYQWGDHPRTIDWKSSARLSSAVGRDEFVVRERFAEETPRVVLVCDRRPGMGLFPPGYPWLSKPRALRVAAEVIADSAGAARAPLGYVDFAPVAATGRVEPRWLPPRSLTGAQQGSARVRFAHALADGAFEAPAANVAAALEYLTRFRGTLPPGSFVFVLSDFIVMPAEDAWLNALQLGWDVVPVIVQDPVWEQSFPPIAHVVAPIADPATGRVRPVRLTRREAARRRDEHEARLDGIERTFAALDLDTALVGSSEREQVLRTFLGWAERRESLRTAVR